MLNDAETELVAREIKARTGAVLTREMGAAIGLRLQPLARRRSEMRQRSPAFSKNSINLRIGSPRWISNWV